MMIMSNGKNIMMIQDPGVIYKTSVIGKNEGQCHGLYNLANKHNLWFRYKDASEFAREVNKWRSTLGEINK